MKVSQEYAEALAEVYIILNTIEKELINKLPNKLLRFIKENKSNEYKPCFEVKDTIYKEKLKPKTRQFLAYLYYTYWCNEVEKAEYEQILKANENEYQKMIKGKYSQDNLFKDKKKVQAEAIKQNIAIEKYRETIIRKIFNKIKNFFVRGD